MVLGDTERSRAIFELAITQPRLDMPELVWKSYLDSEISAGNLEYARKLYRRLLEVHIISERVQLYEYTPHASVRVYSEYSSSRVQFVNTPYFPVHLLPYILYICDAYALCRGRST